VPQRSDRAASSGDAQGDRAIGEDDADVFNEPRRVARLDHDQAGWKRVERVLERGQVQLQVRGSWIRIGPR
jgi:hypothetical protein